MELAPQTLASWVSRLVQIPSVNTLHAGPSSGQPGEKAIAEFLAGTFHDLGAHEVVLDEVVADRPNVYAFFRGHTDRLVVLDVHTDTVTVENMTDPPFDGRIESGAVWGRGALDTKASLGTICALLESWKQSGLRPDPTLLVVGSISEEAGGLLGAARFRLWAEDRGLDIDQLIISEPTELSPIHGHKGAIGLVITVEGVSAHSSTPDEGANAIYAAARIVTALEQHHYEVSSGPAHTEMGPGSLVVAIIRGGIAGNVVPDRCTVQVGRRMAPGEDVITEFERIAALARTVSPLPITVEPVLRNARGLPGSPAFYQTADTSLVRLLCDAAGTSPATAPFGTNALAYDGFVRDKVVFGPGRIEDAHRSTEHVRIDDLERTARAFTAWLQPH